MARSESSSTAKKARSIGDALADAEDLLAKVSHSPRLDAELLLMHATGLPRWKVMVDRNDAFPVDADAAFMKLVNRRLDFEPVAYITGEREFWGLSFTVNPSVLIPRPESELLVEEACTAIRKHARETHSAVRIADLGTGSGCLAISIVKELRKHGIEAICTAVDVSPEALSVAASNAARHNVADAIEFALGDWFGALTRDKPASNLVPFDLIVANPPYVGEAEPVTPDTRHEPSTALFAGDHGLADANRIVSEAPKFLVRGGQLLCEVGAGKRSLMKPWLETIHQEWECELLGDDSPDDRFTVVRFIKI